MQGAWITPTLQDAHAAVRPLIQDDAVAAALKPLLHPSGGQECPAYMFLLDLALRYFVSCLYSLNGFMEPLRTGLSEGAFCVLGDLGKHKVPRLRSG